MLAVSIPPEGGCAGTELLQPLRFPVKAPEMDGVERCLLPLRITPGCSPELWALACLQ